MSKSARRSVNLKLSTAEFAALAADATKLGTTPTTMALTHVLAGMQKSRAGIPDPTALTQRASKALRNARNALEAAGKIKAARTVETERRKIDAAETAHRAAREQIVWPGWRVKGLRHGIAWTGPGAGRPEQKTEEPGS